MSGKPVYGQLMVCTLTDAACLRRTSRILEARVRRRTFMLRVIVKVLRISADRMEQLDAG